MCVNPLLVTRLKTSEQTNDSKSLLFSAWNANMMHMWQLLILQALCCNVTSEARVEATFGENCYRDTTILSGGLLSDLKELAMCKIYTTNVFGKSDSVSILAIRVWITSCVTKSCWDVYDCSCILFGKLQVLFRAVGFEAMGCMLQVTPFIPLCWVHMHIGVQRQLKKYSI